MVVCSAGYGAVYGPVARSITVIAGVITTEDSTKPKYVAPKFSPSGRENRHHESVHHENRCPRKLRRGPRRFYFTHQSIIKTTFLLHDDKWRYSERMKRDGRLLDHRTLEAIRLMAVEASTGRRASVISGGIALRLQSHDDLPLALRAPLRPGVGLESARREAGDGSSTQFDATPGATGVSLDQWSRSAPVWPGLWIVDAVGGG